jgi:hypothetical protein
MKSKVLAVIVAIAVLAGLGLPMAQDAYAERRIISLSPKQLTGQLAARFPQRRCLLGLACVTLTDPVVRLVNGDPRLFVTARASPDIGSQPLGAGVIEVAGKPRYEAASGAFFIDAPEILRMEFPDLPQAYVAQATGLSRELLTDYLRQTPVWVLDERDSQQALAKLVLRQVEVRDGALRLVIGDDD